MTRERDSKRVKAGALSKAAHSASTRAYAHLVEREVGAAAFREPPLGVPSWASVWLSWAQWTTKAWLALCFSNLVAKAGRPLVTKP
jgi:hypothetical protein